MELYKRIRSRREELGMSQEELAKKIGYKSRSSINKIEMGENDIPQSKIQAFADALNTSPAYLMGLDDESKMCQDETFEHYLNKIGIPCEYVSIQHSALYDGPLHEEYYAITLFDTEYHLSLNDYKHLNENVISLVIEYATNRDVHLLNKFLSNFIHLSDIGKKKAIDNIEDLAKLYTANNTLAAAHDRTDIKPTAEMKQYDEDIMDDENF